jgi:dUTP pyrophosphatase
MLIYLSYPIDRAGGEINLAVANTIGHLQTELGYTKHHLFQPGKAFWLGKYAEPDPTIETINQAAQQQAEAVIAIWPRGAKSWGVPVEIERALQNGQKVAFLTDGTPTWAMPTAWNTDPHFKTYQLSPIGVREATKWVTEAIVGPRPRTTPLPYKRLTAAAQTPTRAYPDDAGLDLYVTQTTKIKPGQFVDVPSDIAIQLPPNTWAMLTGRSSTLRKHGLMVNQGIIDPGYRGELYAGVWNLTRKTVTIRKGERLAQLILMPNWTAEHHTTETTQLTNHPRGTQGFGSSGQ